MSGVFGAIVLAYAIAGFYALFGGVEGSLQSLSTVGHTLLIPWALIGCLGLVRQFRHDSAATTGSFALVELRKRNRARWLAKASASTIIGAAAAWLIGYGALNRLASRLDGPTTAVEATVTSAPKFRRNSKCLDVGVRLAEGEDEWICVQRSFFTPDPPPAARCARVGDLLTLEARETVLGRVLRVRKGPVC